MYRALASVGLAALLAAPASAQEQTFPSWLRSSAPPEFLANYGVGLIGLQRAIGSGFTGAGSVIVVIDDGFFVDHPVFSGRLIEVRNPDIARAAARIEELVDDLGPNPAFDDVVAAIGEDAARIYFDFESGAITADEVKEALLRLWTGHGTHVAGIAAGVAPNARFVLLTDGGLNSKLFGEAFLPYVAQMFRLGADRGAVVYNNSWGFDIQVDAVTGHPAFAADRFRALANAVAPEGQPVGTADEWQAFVDAMRHAQRTGVVVFAGSNSDDLSEIDVSAGLPLVVPELREAWIAVVNVGKDGGILGVRCFSAAEFCLAAPGEEIVSALVGGGFGPETGTSMATPHVAGAVALAREIFPAATPADLAQLVLQTATDVGAPGVDPVYGWGILNVGNIVDTIDPRTAATFANASWSRFAAMGHAGSALRQRLTLPASTSGTDAAGGVRTGPAAFYASSTGGAVGVSNPVVSGLWVAPLYGHATIGSGPTSRGARADTVGVLAGVDLVDDAFLRFGIAGGYTQTRLSTRGSADGGKSDAFHVGLYGSFVSDAWFVQASGQVAFFDQSITRHEIAGARGTSRTPIGRSTFRGTAFEADARFGYAVELGNVGVLSPYLAARALWQRANGFRETGAGIFGLDVPSNAQTRIALGPGLRWTSAPIALQGASLRVEADIAYARLVGDVSHQTDVGLLGRRIGGRTAEIGRDVLRVGGRLNVTGDDDTLSGFIGYDGTFQQRAVSHGVSAGVSVRF